MKKKLHFLVFAFVATFFFVNESFAQLHMQRAENKDSAPAQRITNDAPEGLIHYWHFNDQIITEDDEVPADYSALVQGMITYPGTGAGYMDFRTHRPQDPVSNFNLQMGQEPDQGAVLRVRNPANTRELIIAAPSTGFEDLVVTFATTRTENGAQQQEFYFSHDNGLTWEQVGDTYDIPELEDDLGIYLHKVIDLTEYSVVNDNPHLHFKILFVGEGADNPSGNNRFDNLTLEGSPLGLELIHYWHFNDQLIDENDVVPSDYSLVGEGAISYPGTGDGYMDFRTHRPQDPVSNFNLRMGQEPDQGAVLRVRNPADTRELIIAAPSTGYEDLVVTFATTRTSNGAQEQEFYFSPDNGDSWVLVGEAYAVPELEDDLGIYLHKVINLTEYPEVNNNSELHFKILAVGEGAGNSSGNQRFDNLTLDGKMIQTDLPPSKLHFTDINNGETVYMNEAFSVTIHALNDDNIPAAVEEDTEVTLTLATGNGNLGGNLSGIIEEGSFSVTIEGVLYDVAESGVSIHVTADDLASAVSDEFEVLLRMYSLTLESFPPGAGVLTGAGDYAAGEEVTITAEANDGYTFSHWSVDGDQVSENAEYTLIMPAEDLTVVANFEALGDFRLIHYWHFNELPGGTLEEVESDFSLVGQGLITYPGEGPGYMDNRAYSGSNPVSNFNLRLGQEPDQGGVLRVRNPSIDRILLIAAPSTGFADLEVIFAVTRTENGNQEQEFYFSPDAGDTWTLVKEAYYLPFYEEEEPPFAEVMIDLSAYEEANDNPDLHFKVLFVGEGNDNESGNNRFDNLTLDGRALSDDVSVTDMDHLAPSMQVFPNPASDYFNIMVNEPNMLIRIYDISGKLVYQSSLNGKELTIPTNIFSSGVHIVRGISATTGQTVSMRVIIP